MIHLRRGALKGLALCAAVLFFSVCAVVAQQSLGTLRGNVKDELGGGMIGATVTVAGAVAPGATGPGAAAGGVEKPAEADEQGNSSFAGLAPGRYTVRINQGGF